MAVAEQNPCLTITRSVILDDLADIIKISSGADIEGGVKNRPVGKMNMTVAKGREQGPRAKLYTQQVV